MKSFAKLSVLLALIAIGRYLRVTEPTLFQTSEKAIAHRPAKADTLQFAAFSTAQVSSLTPVSQRAVTPKTEAKTEPVIWY